MTLNDYREQFKRNMMVMSRTANGTLDLSASTTKAESMAAESAGEAQRIAHENTDRAVEFLFDNRKRNFRSAKDLEELVLETAKITNKGILKEGCLFRSGEDSTKFNYVRIKDLPAMWDNFILIFYAVLTAQHFEVAEIAAFSEYIINTRAHFFADSCGKISMLISAYLFMRFDLPCPEYTSRDDYYRAAGCAKVPTVSELYHLGSDPEFSRFVSYYLSLCRNRGGDDAFTGYLEKADDGSYVCRLNGRLMDERNRIFRKDIENFYRKHGNVPVVFDCTTLAWIDMEGIRILTDLKEAGKRFVLRSPNIDCMVLFRVAGLEDYLEENDRLPEIDLSGCEKISEGANGIIYKVSDEVVAKTFKDEPDYYDIARQRNAMKNALIADVPAPLSLGYALCDGRIVTLMEFIRSKSLMQIINTEEDSSGYIIRYAQFVWQLHEIRDDRRLQYFIGNSFGKEILSKADRCDSVLREEYRGRAREIIEALDEPECLVHGDIQPKNIMVCGDEMMFIDFDSFSTGMAVYDLGALYRTLLCNENSGVSDHNSFLKLSFDECRRIWETFTGEYFKDEPAEAAQKKIMTAELIGTVLALAKFIKNGADRELISRWAAELERLVAE